MIKEELKEKEETLIKLIHIVNPVLYNDICYYLESRYKTITNDRIILNYILITLGEDCNDLAILKLNYEKAVEYLDKDITCKEIKKYIDSLSKGTSNEKV